MSAPAGVRRESDPAFRRGATERAEEGALDPRFGHGATERAEEGALDPQFGRGATERLRAPSGFVDRSKHEDRAAAESLGRRPVAQDELPDRAAAARIPVVENLGFTDERSTAHLDLDRGIDQEVRRPRAVEGSGRNKDRTIGLVDVTDGDRAPLPCPPTSGPEPGEPAIDREGVVECRNPVRATRRSGRPRVAVAGRRQRARCPDLPSVATDGA
jgi:hypothetical protein